MTPLRDVRIRMKPQATCARNWVSKQGLKQTNPQETTGNWRDTQWIGLRENLQEAIDFPIKYRGFRLKCSHHPILWDTQPCSQLGLGIRRDRLGGWSQYVPVGSLDKMPKQRWSNIRIDHDYFCVSEQHPTTRAFDHGLAKVKHVKLSRKKIWFQGKQGKLK